ncbi:uncharacterized protein LACBIDRAFT_325720 [Laccaria bicolor S238N-H82]|uniref:Predicted protein n=1 Tax=Laccaria bicolor (strain S238N-H82 / ATCC MYA-4686) TaxID=486041 RepID=B0D601_LACBS|nr:uncharacterized protein LACBIDRAFT_325720 [Laccaria bicolor S238N-H82]EDR09857.1 predicted protein [Laccaria bicolor S238N-H82]|eukprot:XP_001879242.1 predicted protein [Laccaria bicolor S238N-H82]
MRNPEISTSVRIQPTLFTSTTTTTDGDGDGDRQRAQSPYQRANRSLLRGRPRNSSQSHIHLNADHPLRELSPSPQPPSPNANARRSRVAPMQQSASHQAPTMAGASLSPGLGLSNMLRRRRSAGNIIPASTSASIQPPPPQAVGINTEVNRTAAALTPAVPPPRPHPHPPTSAGGGATRHIRLVPHLDSRRSLRFDAIGRDMKEGDLPLRIGRFTDRSGIGLAAVNALGSNKLAFRSKVVSRAHAEIWVEHGAKFYIKDTKSSSGTFLNHVRLSPANTESRPFQIKDGDILQLGVDYQGGAEDIYKSVKIRVELGREWQAAPNAFNTSALKNLKTLAVPSVIPSKSTGGAKLGPKSQIPDCCICLFGVTIRQALFIAPCSHTFHYKCIRPLLESHHPGFSCPLCRTFADLEEDVEVEHEADMEIDVESPVGSDEHGHGGDDDSGMEDAEDEGQADEEMVDLNALAEEEVAVAMLDNEGGDDMGVRVIMDGEDIDGTVGGKRKRIVEMNGYTGYTTEINIE